MLQVQVITVDVSALTTEGLWDKMDVLDDSMKNIMMLVCPLEDSAGRLARARVRHSTMYQEYQGAYNDCAHELIARHEGHWKDGKFLVLGGIK